MTIRAREAFNSALVSALLIAVATKGSGLINEHFDLRPAAFRQYLKLHRPVYSQTAAYGHFGRSEEGFTWERTDKAQALRDSAALVSAER